MNPKELRQRIEAEQHTGPTTGYCDGHIQANLTAVPVEFAAEFESFCQANPQPCPLLEIIPAGQYLSKTLAPGADIRSVIPQYQMFENGEPTQRLNHLKDLELDNFVFFLLGCSFSFENALVEAGIHLRHIEKKQNVSMYQSNITLNGVGVFKGNMVVSMRPIKYDRVTDATMITAHFPQTHGAPIHIGYPELIGIKNIDQPDYGDAVEIRDGEIPVFWACGVTPFSALKNARLPMAITHLPGHMFVSDLKDIDYYEPLS